jgi:hydroxymethylpyrimidine kinase/phosphomethylpyrimidine kinase/thiamine-phosphate diphosphorylase
MSPLPPIAWTIAGSDSGGGAGIQADLPTFRDLNVYGCAVVTAVTAQNTRELRAIQAVAPALVEAQLAVLTEDLPAAAVKVGMLGSADAVKLVADTLRRSNAFVVYDPVMTASVGGLLMPDDALEAVRRELLPRVDLITPNLPEAAALAGFPVESDGDVLRAAHAIRALGPHSVLVKGGHAGGDRCIDYWTDGHHRIWLSSPRLATPHTHGGGCTLSSAIAAGVAGGLQIMDSLVLAKAYLNQGLRHAAGVGHGHGPVTHRGWPADPADMPWLTTVRLSAAPQVAFPPMEDARIGLYPIVDRADWVERLAALGVRTIQIRVKDLEGEAQCAELAGAAAAARKHGARLFINDHWQHALKLGVYGVHLGQDDLDGADLAALAAAGLRLGVSTHGYAEVARALAVRPSYLAIGTIFPSPSKSFAHAPMGVPAFAQLRRLIRLPVVAIGGITATTAPELRAAGADGLAVISDITRAPDLPQRIHEWDTALAAR